MNNWCICWFFTHIFTGDFNFKGLTARRLYKSFGVKGLIIIMLKSHLTEDLDWRNKSVIESEVMMGQWSKSHSGEVMFYFLAMSKLSLQTRLYTLFHLEMASYRTLKTLMKKVSEVVSCTCTRGNHYKETHLYLHSS
jgi:hypothetical protein